MRSRARSLALGLGLALAAVLAAGGGYRAYRVYQSSLPILPDYIEVPEGRRAPPSPSAFGFDLSSTDFDALSSALEARGADCVDASASLVARQMRESKLARLDAEGMDEIDGVSRASLSRPSRYERNPQIRYSCETLPTSMIGLAAEPGEGRLLAIFDGPEQSIRSLSFQRTFDDEARARAALRAAIARYRRLYGAPTAAPEDLEAVRFERYVPVTAMWEHADLEIRVSLTRFGARIAMDETAQVPWPIRPDAHRLARALPIASTR